MADKKFFNGKVATKVTEDMVGKAIGRISSFSILPEFKRDADNKLERDENGKAMVDPSKDIIVFSGVKAKFRSKVNLAKSMVKTAFGETVTEATDIYLNLEANGDVAEGLKRAVDKGVLKSDTALSALILTEKDGDTYKATILDWEFAPYRHSTFHGEWFRPVTENIVGRVIARLNYVRLVPEFKRDAENKMERDENGKAIIDATKPLVNFSGSNMDAKANFKVSPYLAKSVAKAYFDEDMDEGRIYMSVTAFGFTAMNMQRLNEKNPIDLNTAFNFDLFTKKNGGFLNGQVLGFSKIPAKADDVEDVGGDIMSEAMNAPTSAPVDSVEPTGSDEPVEFPF